MLAGLVVFVPEPSTSNLEARVFRAVETCAGARGLRFIDALYAKRPFRLPGIAWNGRRLESVSQKRRD